MVNIGGICDHDWQCTGTESADICVNGFCSCSPEYIKIDRKCYQGKSLDYQVYVEHGVSLLVNRQYFSIYVHRRYLSWPLDINSSVCIYLKV